MYAVVGRFAFRTAPDAALRARVEAEIIDPLSQSPGFQNLYFIPSAMLKRELRFKETSIIRVIANVA